MEDKEIRYLAKLAHIRLKKEEIVRLKDDLGKILEYVGQLNSLATETVTPACNPARSRNKGGPDDAALPKEMCLREDTARPSLPREIILKNRPESENGFLRVPRVIKSR